MSMTPERIEEIKAMITAMKGGLWSAEYEMIEQATVIIPELSAALEEAQQQLWTAKEERDSQQRVCIKAMEELAEAQQTIARQREALEKIAEDLGKLPMDHPGLWMVYNVLMSELRNKEGEKTDERQA